jgi:hypothetical protein
VRGVAPDVAAVARLDRSGLIVTAAGEDPYDFVSRYFAPAKGIPEDPVTSSAHCMLVPYWAERLRKLALRAFQASQRGGELTCRLVGDRVTLEGACVFYAEGEIEVQAHPVVQVRAFATRRGQRWSALPSSRITSASLAFLASSDGACSVMLAPTTSSIRETSSVSRCSATPWGSG